MDYYKEMYYSLFNEVAQVIEKLQIIQQKTEQMYPEMGEDTEESCLLNCERKNVVCIYASDEK